jgi:hypothetical protein
MSQDNQTLSDDAPKASRRALLMGLAVAATPMAPALANALSEPARTGVDPIFAAIEHERAAYTVYLATAAAADLDDPIPPPSRDDPDFEEANKRRMARPEHKAWWARWKEADAAHAEAAQGLWAARGAFLETQPTSVAGLLAFLDHIEGPFSSGEAGEAFWDEEEHKLAFPTLSAATRNIIARGHEPGYPRHSDRA